MRAKWPIIAILSILLLIVSPALASVQDDIIIKQMVATDKPAIVTATNDWDKVNIIRQWAYEHITRSSNLTTNLAVDSDFYSQDAYQLFSSQIAGKRSAWCAGAAYSLFRLYQAFGYNAYYFGGATYGYSHAAALVDINYNGVPMIVLEDALFNQVITYTDGSPIPYQTFKSKADQDDLLDVMVTKGTYTPVKVIDSAPSTWLPSTLNSYGNWEYWYPAWTFEAYETPSFITYFTQLVGRPLRGGSVYFEWMSSPITPIPVATRQAPVSTTIPTPTTVAPTAIPTTVSTPVPTVVQTTTTAPAQHTYIFTIMIQVSATGSSQAEAWNKVMGMLSGSQYTYVDKVIS